MNTFAFRDDNDDTTESKVILQRVRKNQQKHVVMEFYDEDDIGHEWNNNSDNDNNDDDDDFYNRVVSHKPVGGPGRKKSNTSSNAGIGIVQPRRPSKQTMKQQKNKQEESGFFTRSTTFHQNNNNNEQQQQQQQQNNYGDDVNHMDKKKKNEEKEIQTKKKKRKEGVPLLDSKGKKMYLTINQVNSLAPLTHDTSDADDYDSQTTTQTWEDLGITHPILLENLRTHMSCPQPLPVQYQSCTAILASDENGKRNNVILSTPTGSGKTLAFLVPLIQRLLQGQEEEDGLMNVSNNIQAMVIAPGRELASQIVHVGRQLTQNMPSISCQLAIGGTPIGRTMDQIRKKKPTILIGTPGRLAELAVGIASEKKSKTIKFHEMNSIILDECDALLLDDDDENNDGGNKKNPHSEPTQAILNLLNRQHSSSLQTVLCSATAPDLVRTNQEYEDYHMVKLSSQQLTTTTTSPTALHGVVHVPHRRFALDFLKKILHTHPMPEQVLIFVNSPHRVKITVQKVRLTNNYYISIILKSFL